MQKSRALIVESDMALGELLLALLAEAFKGGEVILVKDTETAGELLQTHSWDLIVASFPGPRPSGELPWPIVNICKRLGLREIPIIGLTTQLFEADHNLEHTGLVAIFPQPFDSELFLATIISVYIGATMREALTMLHTELPEFQAENVKLSQQEFSVA